MMNGIQNTKANDYQVAVKMAKTHSKEQLETMYKEAQKGQQGAQGGQGGPGQGPGGPGGPGGGPGGPGGPGGGPGGPGGPGGAGKANNSKESGEAEAGRKPEVVKQALEIKQKDETNLSSDAQSGNESTNQASMMSFSMNLQSFAGVG